MSNCTQTGHDICVHIRIYWGGVRCRVCSWGLTRAWIPWRSPRALASCHACPPVQATPTHVHSTAPPPEPWQTDPPSALYCTEPVLSQRWQCSGSARWASHGNLPEWWHACWYRRAIDRPVQRAIGGQERACEHSALYSIILNMVHCGLHGLLNGVQVRMEPCISSIQECPE